MKYCTRILAAAALLAPWALAQQPGSPEEILAGLKAGNARYVAGDSRPQPMGPGVRRTLARGQAPRAVVVTCADSRVVPEHLFNAGLGELYVLRVAGNVADPDTVAGIEHATLELGARLVVVLGHESCGAVGAALPPHGTSHGTTPSIARLLERIEPAVQKARAMGLGGKDLAKKAEEENVHQAVEDALRQSRVLRRMQDSGQVGIARARYSLSTGEVAWLPDRPFGMPEVHPAPGGETAPAPIGLPPHVALRMIQSGHRRYLSAAQPTGDISAARRQALAGGQQPLAIVVTDGDSRVPPEHIFDAGLGEIFTIRVAGPVLNDEVLASIEYAAAHTGASLCLVLGHGDNELFRKVLQGKLDERPMTDSMRQLAQKLEPVVGRAKAQGGNQQQIAERALTYQLQRFVTQARTRSDMLRGLEAKGTFAMLAATYDLESGDLAWVKTASPGAAPAGETNSGHGGADVHGGSAHDTGHATGHANGDATGHAADHGGHGDDHGDHTPHGATAFSAHDSALHDSSLDADVHGNSDYEMLASMADARAGGEGHGDGHGETAGADAAHPTKAAGGDTLTIVLIMLTGVLAAAVGISLLLWMQRQRPEVALDDAAAE